MLYHTGRRVRLTLRSLSGVDRREGYSLDNTKENSVGKIVDKIDLDNGWWYCAKDIGKTLAKTKLTGSHRAVIDFILDKTYGWKDPKNKSELTRKRRKTSEDITFKEFEVYTRLGYTRLSENIEKLIKWNVIKRKKNGWKRRYSLNVNVSEWNKGIFRDKKQTKVTEKRNHLSDENDIESNDDNSFKPKNDKLVTEKRNHLDKLVTEKQEIGYGETYNHLRKSVSNNRCDTIKDKALLVPNELLEGTIYKEEEKDHTIKDNHLGKEEEIINYWNTYNINPCKDIKPYIQDIKEALKDYSVEEIKLAIRNYVYILTSEYYKFDHQYYLDSFLKAKTIVKFIDLEKAKNNYKDYTFKQEDEGDFVSDPYVSEKVNNQDKRTREEIQIERDRVANLAGIEARKMRETKENYGK